MISRETPLLIEMLLPEGLTRLTNCVDCMLMTLSITNAAPTVLMPEASMLMRSIPFTSKDNLLGVSDEMPVLVPFENCNDGCVADPGASESVFLIETMPLPSMLIRSTPLVSNESLFDVSAEKPVLVLPANCSEGFAAEPAMTVKVPIMLSPARNTFSVEVAVIETAVMMLAAKLPVLSRCIMVLGRLRLVAEVAELSTLPGVLMVASLVSAICALAAISALTISELNSCPVALL